MITDHRYDAGWPRDDSKGCIVQVGTLEVFVAGQCGQPEHVHMLSEYPSQRPDRNEHQEHRPQAGDMHEPAPYPFPLDWEDDPVLHPFVD